MMFKDYWTTLLEFEVDPTPAAKKWLTNILSLACKKDQQCK